MENFKNLIQCLEYFKDETTCKKYLELQRWGENVSCPHCGALKPYRTNVGFKCSDSKCYKKFTVKVGTIFQDSKINLRLWFAAIYLATSHKKGISSIQLAKDLSVTQKTAWYMLMRIREMYRDNGEQLDGVLEIDETYQGGKISNKHKSKRAAFLIGKNGVKLSTKHANKEPVLGIVQRGGAIRLTHIPDITNNTILEVIRKNVVPGSIVYTDEGHAYKHLIGYKHDYISHSQNQFVDGDCHTQTIEGSFGLLKNGLRGIQHSVSPKHLQRYLNEFSYKYSNRGIKDGERFHHAFKYVANPLPYKQLVKKETKI